MVYAIYESIHMVDQNYLYAERTISITILKITNDKLTIKVFDVLVTNKVDVIRILLAGQETIEISL